MQGDANIPAGDAEKKRGAETRSSLLAAAQLADPEAWRVIRWTTAAPTAPILLPRSRRIPPATPPLATPCSRTVEDFYHTDNIAFSWMSDEYNGHTVDQYGKVRPAVTRHYETLSQAAYENAESRIYLGIHWPWDRDKGLGLTSVLRFAEKARVNRHLSDIERGSRSVSLINVGRMQWPCC